MEDVDSDLEDRLDEIRYWEEDLRKEYGIYAAKAQDIILHYLMKYRYDSFLIYLGVKDADPDSETHLEIRSQLFGIQALIASSLKGIEKGEETQLELDWYIYRALEIKAPQRLIDGGYLAIREKYPDLYDRAVATLETYLVNYRSDLRKYLRPGSIVDKFKDNMDALDVMICILWICQWLSEEEEEGKDIRREMDGYIREHLKLPPNMIPIMKEGGKKRRISHPFDIIEGGKD